MATSSFKKEFQIKDAKTFYRLADDVMSGKATVKYEKKDVQASKEKEAELLARLASA